MKTSRFILLMLFSVAHPGWAQDHPIPFSGVWLKSSCEASVEQKAELLISLDQMISATACRSYLTGFIQSSAFSEGALAAKRLFCIPPEGISVEDAAIVVHAFATQHSGISHLPAAAIVAASLKQKFPCPTTP
jgi:hypothetical protein